jgi:hypothetical protein
MAGFLESLGQGLQSAGEVLSPQVYEKNAIERRGELERVAQGLQIKKAQRALDADTKFAEAVGGLQPSSFKSSEDMLDALKGVPLDVIAESPRAQATLQMASQMHQREAAQEARKAQIQQRYDQLAQQADIARQRSEDTQLGIQERAAADKRHTELQAEVARMRDAASQANIDLRRDMERDRKSRMEEGLLTDQEARFMARQYLAGDKSVFQNLGRGQQGSENIVRLRRAAHAEAVSMGMKPEQIAAKMAEFEGIKAGERTLGTRTANIEMAVTEAQQMAPLALEASQKVDRTQYPSLNKVLLAAEKGTGDENVVRLGVATNSLVNIYARAINPTGVPTVSDKEHARELLASAWSKGQYQAGVDQLMKELAAARKSPGIVRKEFSNAVTGEEKKDAVKTTVESGVEAQAQKAWGAYEPDKYEYRTQGGKLQRRPKSGG